MLTHIACQNFFFLTCCYALLVERCYVVRNRRLLVQTNRGNWFLNASVFLQTTQPEILLVAQDLPMAIRFFLFCYTGSKINTINVFGSDITKISSESWDVSQDLLSIGL